MSAPTTPSEVLLPRILRDLGEGRLDEQDAEALGAWIAAHGLIEPPELLIVRGLQVASGVRAGAA